MKNHWYCSPCGDTGLLNGGFVFGRKSACTCGAGLFDGMTLHDGSCDSVPCPFCQLASRPPQARAL